VRGLAVAIVIAFAAPARAQPLTDEALAPKHEGFTIELDGGLGVTRATGLAEGNVLRPAVGGVDLGFGAFVTPELAMLFRFAAQTFWVPTVDNNRIAAHAFAGPAIQVWLNDRVFAGGGAGLGIEGGQKQDGSDADSAIGLGVTARAGYAVSVSEDAAWRVSVEAGYGMLEGRRAYSAALLIGWQSF
jgi:hypothetical protein